MVKFCPSCGAEVKDDAKFCPECGKAVSVKPTPKAEPVKKTQATTNKTSSWGKDLTPEQRKSFKILGILGIVIVVVLILALAFGGSGDTSSDTSDTSSDTTYVEPVLSEDEYKANCTTDISYKQLEKNANSFFGEKYKVSGEVFQIGEYGGETWMLLATSGSYDNLMYVTYPGTIDVYEGDYVTVWGEIYGDYSYTSKANYQLTVPWISAKYIE